MCPHVSEVQEKRTPLCSFTTTKDYFVGKNKSQCIFGLSQLTLKVKGQKRPVMLQKDPRDICTLSFPPSLSLSHAFLPSLTLSLAPTLPLGECRSEHCSRPLAFTESCTAMRSLCLLPLSSSTLPLLWLSLSHPSTSLSFPLFLTLSLSLY